MDVRGQTTRQSCLKRALRWSFWAGLAIIGAICLFPTVSMARPNQGGIGALPGLDTGIGMQSIIIHDSNGGITTGLIDRNSGTVTLSGPQNQLTIGQEDNAGNIVIQQFGGDDDD